MRHGIGPKAWGWTVRDYASQLKYGSSSSSEGSKSIFDLVTEPPGSVLRFKKNVFSFIVCQLDEICQHNRYEETTVRTSIETGTPTWLRKKVKWLMIINTVPL